MPQTSPHSALLIELEPVVAQNLDRHDRLAKEWHPHDYVPWDEGRNFAFLGGEDWSPEQSRLDETAKAAMFVNLLTEDNLPSYHREIATRFGRDGAWGTWVGRWTAEENRHGVALRDYLVVTRGVDPVELERARMDYMTLGYDSGDKTPLEAVAYVSFQELATRVSHRNTGKATGDPIADQLLARIATDENLHMVFYRNLVQAAFDINPDEMMRAVANEVIGLRDARRQHGQLPEELDDHRQGRHLRPAAAPRRGRRPDPARSGRSSSAPTSAPRARRPARSWPSSWSASTPRRRSSSRAASACAPASPPAARCRSRSEAESIRRAEPSATPLVSSTRSCASRPGTSTPSAAAPTAWPPGWSAATSTSWRCRRPSAATTSSPRCRSRRSATRSRTSGYSQWNGVAVLSRSGIEDVEIGFPGQPTWGETAGRRGPRARRHLRRRPGVEPVRAQRPHAGRPALPLQARLAGRAARRRPPAGWPRTPTRRSPWSATGTSPRRTTTSGTWRSSSHSTHVSPPERAAFRAVVDAGYADVVRPHTPGPGVYTYWDYTQLRFPRREGMRIDFVLGSPALAARVAGALIDREERKGKGASDHAPVVVDLAD